MLGQRLFWKPKEKYLRRIFLILVLSLPLISNGQFQYSIDKSKLKASRRLTISERIENFKQKREQRLEKRRIRHEDKMAEKLARKYAKEKQTKLVQKRMKETRQMAQKFNRGKPAVDFYTYMEYKIKKRYGKYF